jgi:L-alanine-DL-glutamate epimerase-like enolase superfamily enzyme
MPRPQKGKIELPDKPGLGVELDRKAIEKWVEK